MLDSTRTAFCLLDPPETGDASYPQGMGTEVPEVAIFGHIPYLEDADNMQAQSSLTALPAPSATRKKPSGMQCQICGPSAGGPAPAPAGDSRTGRAPGGEEEAADVDMIEEDDAEAPPRRRTNALQREAKTVRHMAIHRPYNPHCQICRDAMARRRNKPDRRKQREKAAARSGEVVDPSAGRANLSFGDRCTGDYLLQRRADLPSEIHDDDGEEFSYGAKAGAVFLDLGTDWKTIEPVQYLSLIHI